MSVFMLLAGLSASSGCVAPEDEHESAEDRNTEIVDNLIEAGFDEAHIEVREAAVLDDSAISMQTEQGVFVDGDVRITLAASRELLDEIDADDDAGFRHWRTPARVNNNRTICLVRVTSAATAQFTANVLPTRMRTAVARAAANYNALSSFNLTFKVGNGRVNAAGVVNHNTTGCDYQTIVYREPGAAGGSAGFPSGGAPFGRIILRSGLLNRTNPVIEHVVTHEIGHTIGLRHTDWRTRASCGGAPVNEGRHGAIRIPNTADQTTNSVMSACFAANETGNFQGEDAEALQRIY